MRQINIRKPVSFPMYHVLIVRSNTIWTIDNGTWDETEARRLEKEEISLSGRSNVKLVTSPTDNDIVIRKIVARFNHPAKR